MATFKFYGMLKDKVEDGQITVNGNNNVIDSLSEILEGNQPLKEMLAAYDDTYQVIVNGEMVQFLDDGLQTRLEDDDVVQVFPPVSGGGALHGLER